MNFQILSLSGGGIFGLYTINFICDLEKQIKRPIATCFDLLAGTSIGGIIAIALALEIPAEKIKKSFEDNGSLIFSKRPAPKSRREEWVDLFRSLFKSKYSDSALLKTVESLLGSKTIIGNLKHPTIIPAVNLTKGKPQIFKTAHHPDFKIDWKRIAFKVALATSAAPTYFPVAEMDDELFADGGLYANSPDLLALHEAEHFLKINLDNIRILSIGTTTTQFSFSHAGGRALGIVGWGKRLAQTMISSQQLDASYILKHKLGDRYLRIDEVQSREQETDLGLDVATLEAQKNIRGIASGSYQANINNPMLSSILNYTAPNPRFYHSTDFALEEPANG